MGKCFKTLCSIGLAMVIGGLTLAIAPAFADEAVPMTSISLSNNESNYPIENPYYFVTAETLSIDEVNSPSFNEEWQPFLSKKSGVRNRFDSNIWFRFDIDPKQVSTNEWLVVVDWSMIDSLQMFSVNQTTNEIQTTRMLGLKHPIEDRYYKSRSYAFPLDTTGNQAQTVYIHMQSSGLLSVPLSVVNIDAFQNHEIVRNLIYGGVFGGLILMFFYNMSLYSVLKENAFLVYCAYILSMIFYFLIITGVGQMYWWDGSEWWKVYSLGTFSSLAFLCATWFLREFFQLKNHKGWLLNTNSMMIVLWAVLAIWSVFDAGINQTNAIGICTIIACLVGAAVGIKMFVMPNSGAKIFILAWAILLSGTAIFVLAIYALIPLNNFTRYAQMFGAVIEMAMLSFALAYRINTNKEIREAAQQEALTLAQRVNEERAQKLVAQRETLVVQKQLNDSLESQVHERTEQLEDTMTKLAQANEELTKLSVTDALTTVHNRRYIDDKLIDECKRAARTKQSLALILVDIDKFKPINDTYGHTVGDKCLREVAIAMKSVINRPGDILARYGGEEFIYLLPSSNQEDAKQVAEHCRKAIEALDIKHNGKPIQLTISAGVAAWVPNDEGGYKELVNAADSALYRAKNAGRNRIMISNSSVEIVNIKS